VHEAHEAAREAVRGALSAAALRSALRRLLPLPARARYVLVTLQPQAPLAARVVRAPARSLLAWTPCVSPHACCDRPSSCSGLLVPSQCVAGMCGVVHGARAHALGSNKVTPGHAYTCVIC
jgi:hypothetical protein